MLLIKDMIQNETWKENLGSEFDEKYFQSLDAYLQGELKKGKTIFPPLAECFNAFNLTPFENVKVVIVGQDPYHGPGQAHGLSFSVKSGIKLPPSLRNIFKELADDYQLPTPPQQGDLSGWAQQGVLLLNAVLTVEEAKAGAHQNKGWEQFTDRVIHLINEQKQNVVFILWGSYAQKKASFLDKEKHLVIEAVHPSPLSAYRGFFGTKPFSQANDYLIKKGMKPVKWDILE